MKTPYRPRWFYWLAQRFDRRLALALIAAIVVGLGAFGLYEQGHPLSNRVVYATVGCMVASAIVLFAYAWFAHLRIGFPNFHFKVAIHRGGVLEIHLGSNASVKPRPQRLLAETLACTRLLHELALARHMRCIRIQSPLLAGKRRMARTAAHFAAALPGVTVLQLGPREMGWLKAALFRRRTGKPGPVVSHGFELHLL